MTDVTLTEARRVCDAAISKAQDMGIEIAVSVVDSATHLVTTQRMDGALALAVEGSRGKAVASVIFGQPSGELEERAQRPTFRALEIQMGGRVIMGQGAVPITRGDDIIGACGVGGGTPQQDEECARAGVAAID